MIRIILILEGYLKNKYPSACLTLNYSEPTTITQVFKDAGVSSADVFFIKIGDSLVKEDYLITSSTKIKIFPLIGGG